jgi:molecular chaperone GrpE
MDSGKKHTDAPERPVPDQADKTLEGSSAAGEGIVPETAEHKAGHTGGGRSKKGDHRRPEDVARISELENSLLRLRADFDNFRKRTLRERDELYSRANEDLVLELLTVLDHMALAIDAAVSHNADRVFLDGFRLVSEQMYAALAKFGLKPVDAVGPEFNPAVHEAISHLASDTVPENAIIAETRRGYMMGERLLRASQVVVSSGPGDTGGDQ